MIRVSSAAMLLLSEFVCFARRVHVNADLLAATDPLERSRSALGDLAVEDVDGESVDFETSFAIF